MTLMRRARWPFSEFVPITEAMERLFDEGFVRPERWWTGHAFPAVDLRTTDEALVVTAAIPGVKREDLEITIDGEVLTIRGTFGKEETAEEPGYLYREIKRGAFTRTLTLPTAVKAEESQAIVSDGLLTLTIPKAEAVRPRHVEVVAA